MTTKTTKTRQLTQEDRDKGVQARLLKKKQQDRLKCLIDQTEEQLLEEIERSIGTEGFNPLSWTEKHLPDAFKVVLYRIVSTALRSENEKRMLECIDVLINLSIKLQGEGKMQNESIQVLRQLSGTEQAKQQLLMKLASLRTPEEFHRALAGMDIADAEIVVDPPLIQS